MTQSVLHIVMALLLLAIPAGALYLMDKSSLRTFAVAVVRMVAQVLLLCLVVWGVIRFDSALANLIWLLLSVAVAALVATHRGRLNAKKFLPSVYCGLLVGTLSVGLYLLYLVIPVRNGMDPRWFVPVMYLLMGHTTTMLIRGVSAYHTALKADEQQYEFLRGNGVTHFQAVKPFVRRALLAVISPTAANLSVMGLYAMPLLLCGIFIGGVAPINAFAVMLMLTFGCVAASVIALFVTFWLADRCIFDKYGKLV